MHSLIKKFTAFDLMIIAMMASLGIAIKPLIVPLVHIITGPLLIPGGSVAGGFYMMWIVLGAGLVNKAGTGFFIGLIQAIAVLGMGMAGSHGIMSLITYTVPGLMVDLLIIFSRHHVCCIVCSFFAGLLANTSGTILVNMIFFRLPLIPLLLALTCASLSGGLGGILAYWIKKRIMQMNILKT